MKVVVFGGGGRVARHFAQLAKDQHTVVAVVRNNKHTPDLEELGARTYVLDIAAASVQDVVRLLVDTHAEASVWAAGAPEFDTELLRNVDYGGVVKVAQAAETAGVRRLVVLSSADAHPPGKIPRYYDAVARACSDMFWKAMPAHILAKYDSEVALHGTDLQFTVLRPGLLHDGPAGGAEMGVVQISMPGVTLESLPELAKDPAAVYRPCSRELVAQTIIFCLAQPGTVGLTFTVVDGDHDPGQQVQLQVAERTNLFMLEA